ncbi:putative zinc finger protein [Daphnia pulex]|uniref:EOG090X06E3 n=1 Tax=Daphnia pulex TaxID=6669 RepID=E9G6P8_DAPPU|nr:putative zinc finger protein [Daphnia pulex]CAG4640025.1 EOG090X06E3 [Daphnia pulex]SVE84874.1 EOG090X06E3 [Daphnia pulex]|eukprot:EFX85155.1 putative zinc finger protein [Daphnia pulex]
MMTFTCISCHVAFKEPNIQREHYKTDWHRYNLKRKVVDLPPVTAEVFQQRVLEQRTQANQQEATKSLTPYCTYCKKKFGSEKSYENHLPSKKHQDNVLNGPKLAIKKTENAGPAESEVAVNEEEIEVEENDSDEWEDDDEAIPVTSCLFCNHKSDSLESSLKHMSSQHSFFIPDFEYVIDIEGMVTYLGERVGQGHICTWCGHLGRQFPSTEAVQKHMLDKGHCKLFHEGEVLLEYSDFYDYSTSYPDGGDANEEVEPNVINDLGFELVLPSGSTIGHRSLNRYYRQKLNPNPRPVPTRAAIQHGNYFKALGWTTSTKEIVEKKVRDITFMRKMFLKNQLGVSVKANKLQKHFRRQVDM